MTDDEKILAVASKLTGEFYVGQRVIMHRPAPTLCTIVALESDDPALHPGRIVVQDDTGLQWTPIRSIVKPL